VDSKNDNAIGTELENRLDDLFGEGKNQGDKKLEQKGTLEVDRRLDDFFGEGKKNPVGKEKKASDTKSVKPVISELENSPLKDLKSVVLSLEWEISDQVMQRLEEEIAKLEKKFKEDKIAVAFLQLLGSLGKYIRKKQADAHPESIGLINSVYENLEKAMLTEGMPEAEKKKMLISEVNKYKKLKENIASVKPSVSKEKPAEKTVPRIKEEVPAVSTKTAIPSVSLSETEDEESAAPLQAGGAANQDIIAALEIINATLKAEFKALREELKQLKGTLK